MSLKLCFTNITSRKENKVFCYWRYIQIMKQHLFHMKKFTGSKWEAGFVENFTIKSASILGNKS